MKKKNTRIPYDNYNISNKDREDKDYHHLFSYREIREKLMMICGDPRTQDQHDKLYIAVKNIWAKLPQFKIDKDHHRDIHKKEQLVKLGGRRLVFEADDFPDV